MKGNKVGRPSYEGIKDVYVQNLRDANRAGTLAEFHRMCIARLDDPSARDEVPYAFAYAARTLLHDRRNWLSTSGGLQINANTIEALDKLLQNSRAINCRDNYYYPVVKGAKEFVSGNFKSSYIHFANASRFDDYYRVVKDDFGGGASFCKAFPTQTDLGEETKSETPIEFWKFKNSAFDLCYSISFDVLYAKAFHLPWIKKVHEITRPETALHFHIIFRQNLKVEILDEIARAGSVLGDRLIISFEVTSDEFDRAYFASARFLHGSRILAKLGCPVWFVDADAELTHGNSDSNARRRSGNRVRGLLSFGPNYGYVPWRAFGATWLYAPPSAFAAGFLDLTRQSIRYLWDGRPGRNWWIDQFGLKTAELYAGLYAPELSPESLDGNHPAPFRTSEAYKIASISNVPEIADRLHSGVPYGRAIREVATTL